MLTTVLPVLLWRHQPRCTFIGLPAVIQALKMFKAIEAHFADFREDQFDFHSYCIRKMTLRAYIDMLSMEDTLCSAEDYVHAAYGAIEAYLHRYDQPSAAQKVRIDWNIGLICGNSSGPFDP